MTDGSVNPNGPATPDEPVIEPADAVIPPPPPETPIPEGLLAPPSREIPSAADVIPPAPEMRRRNGDRPTPALLQGEAPPAAAADWATPSVAPEVPTTGGYRAISAAIFAFLLVLLLAAVALVIYLATNTSLDFTSSEGFGGSVSVAALVQNARLGG